MATKVLPCGCEHKFQDKKYGTKKRLHNQLVKGGYRCTVCGKKKEITK